MSISSSDLLTLFSIGFVQLLAVLSPGPSFLITARTAVARSRAEGVKVALGLGAGTVIWAGAVMTIMLWATLIFMPLIILYTSWAYRVMGGKVTAAYVRENSHSAY